MTELSNQKVTKKEKDPQKRKPYKLGMLIFFSILITQIHGKGKFIKETAKELGGDLLNLGVTTLAEAAIEAIKEKYSSDSDEECPWFCKGKESKTNY